MIKYQNQKTKTDLITKTRKIESTKKFNYDNLSLLVINLTLTCPAIGCPSAEGK
jgi:hypothetical protein